MTTLARADSRFPPWPLLRAQAPFLIITLMLTNTLVGLVGWVHWYTTGDWTWVKNFFQYPNALFSILMGAADFGFCVYARRQFDRRDALRSAWSWLTLASTAHFGARLLTTPGLETAARDVGRVLGGPVHMVLLLVGLAQVAIHCRHLGLLRPLTRSDAVLLLLVGGLTLRTFYGIWHFVSAGKTITWSIGLSWTSDPLLILLLVVAILLRRSASSLGHGMISNGWRAFVAGIVLTSVGNASLWCAPCSGSWIWSSFGWYVWFIADAAYALGPAFHVAALEWVRTRSEFWGAIAVSR